MTQRNHLIPVKYNLVLLTAASVSNLLLLYVASNSPWWGILLAACLFSLTNNTLFSLLHESVHGMFSKSTRVNRIAGCIAALWFPTGWSIQRAFHLTHHENNRSIAEQFDILHPQDIRWLKYAQWYSIFTGFYWAVTVSGVLLYAITPRFLRHTVNRIFGKQGGLQTSADNYIGILDRIPPVTARLEILVSILWQVLVFSALDLSFTGWLYCYAAFALMWSSLQYTDHAFSPLDRFQGAWDLRVPAWLRGVFLNYHLHLAHHQNPQVPWMYLPEYATTGPKFVTVWLECWRGPRSLENFPIFRQESAV